MDTGVHFLLACPHCSITILPWLSDSLVSPLIESSTGCFLNFVQVTCLYRHKPPNRVQHPLHSFNLLSECLLKPLYHPGSLSHVCKRSYPAISISPWIVHGKPAHTTHWTKPITTSLHNQLVGSFLFSLSVLCSSVCDALTYVCAGEHSETRGGVTWPAPALFTF